MQDFRKLRVWAAAHRLTIAVYHATSRFPVEERYGLTSQLRRASASIGANIAEGCGRGSSADTRRCFQIALGSACEVLNHCMLARALGVIDSETFAQLEDEALPVRRMLIALIERMGASAKNAPQAPRTRATKSRAENAGRRPAKNPTGSPG